VDVILHNGAQVSGVLPYKVLKTPNVSGKVYISLSNETRNVRTTELGQ
jgi:thioester reductase-like protein